MATAFQSDSFQSGTFEVAINSFAQAQTDIRYQLTASFPGVAASVAGGTNNVNRLTDNFYIPFTGAYVVIRVTTPPSDGGNIGLCLVTGATGGPDNTNRVASSPQANTTYTLGPFNAGWFLGYSWINSTYRPSLSGAATYHIFLPEKTAVVGAQAQAKIVTQWRFAQSQTTVWKTTGEVNEVYGVGQSAALIKVIGSYPWYVHRHGSNLLAYYRMGDTSTIQYDSSIYQNHATLANNFGYGTSGAIYEDSDYSVDFNGTTQKATTASTTFAYANNVTIEAWVYPTATSYSSTNRDTIWGASDASQQLSLELGGNGGINRVAAIINGTFIAETTDNAITLNQWNHIVYTRTGTGTTHKIYVNGALQTLVTNHNSGSFADAASVKLIGARTASTQFFQGRIDEVAVYKVALNAAEVLEHYTLGASGAWQQYAQAGAEIAGVYVSHSFARVLYSVTNTPVHVSESFVRVVYKVKDPAWAQAQALIIPPQPYRDAVVADSPYGYWPLSDSDQKVRAYVGPQSWSFNGSTYTSAGSWTRAVNAPMPAYDRAQGISNNNVADAIELFVSQYTNNFTVEAWVKPGKTIGAGGTLPTEATGGTYTSYNGNVMSFVYYPNQMGGNRGLGLSVGTNGICVIAHGSSNIYSLLSYAVTLSGWHHVAVVVIDRQPTLYLDGVAVRTGLQNTQTLYSPTVIGDGGSYGYLTGSVSNAALYSTSLTAEQILNHYNNGVARAYAQAAAKIGKQAGFAQVEAFIESPITLVSQLAQAEARIIIVDINQVAQAAARIARYVVSANAMALCIIEDIYYRAVVADSPLAYYRLDESSATLSKTNIVRLPVGGGTATYTMRTTDGNGAADGNYGSSAAEPANTSNYWKVEWSVPQTLDTIAMLDRSDGGGGYTRDYWGSGSFTIDFSDGSQVTVPAIPNGWAPAVVKFLPKSGITWFKINAPATQSGYNPGFQEVEAFLGAPEIKSYGGTQDYNAVVASVTTPPTSTAGLIAKNNTGLNFSGSGLYIGTYSASHVMPYRNLSTASIEAWIKTTSSTGTKAIIAKNAEWGLFVVNGYITFYDYNTATHRTGPFVADETRHHIVLTWTGTTGNLYVDGSLKLSATMTRVDSNYHTTIIGDSTLSAGQYFEGTIDEIAIYDTQLTAEQIRQHFVAGTGIQLAQAQTYIIRNPAFAQAEASIAGLITHQFAQVEAFLTSPITLVSQIAQAEASILLLQNVFAQANAFITLNQYYAQAQAAIIPRTGLLAYLFFQGSGYDHEVGTIQNIWSISAPNMIKYDDGGNKPPGTGTRESYFGVTAIGRFVADETGAWYFHLQSDDASRISIYNSANEIVGTVGAWPAGSAGGTWTGTINLTQGEEYKIIWQWSEAGGTAYVTYNHFKRPSEANESWLTDSNPAPWILEGTRYRWAQAAASIARYNVYALANAVLRVTYNKVSQAQAYMVKDRLNVSAQAIAFIFFPQHANVQARIKQVYQSYSQAQVSVTKYSKLNGHGLSRALIKGVPRHFAYVMASINDRKPHANVLAYIKRGERSVANAQSKIIKPNKRIGHVQASIIVYDQNVFAQVMTTINQMQFTAQSVAKVIGYDYNRFGMAQAWIIKGTQFAQAQARMYGEIYQVHAQARTQIESFTSRSGQARARILRQYRMYAQAEASLKFTESIQVALATVRISRGTKNAFAQAGFLIGTLKYAQTQAFIYQKPKKHALATALIYNEERYYVKYNNYTFPGYLQNESRQSIASINTNSSPYENNISNEYTGLANKIISLRLKVVGESFDEAKNEIQRAGTIFRSNRQNTYKPMYTKEQSRYYLVRPRTIKFEANVTSNTRTIDYEVEFEAKPWLYSETVYQISGTGSVNTGARTVADGTWTPATIQLTGTNITVSGYTEDGVFTGFLSVSGAVTNLIIDSENYTATINGVNKNNVMRNLDYAIFVGPNKTYFDVTGASAVSISYQKRWYI